MGLAQGVDVIGVLMRQALQKAVHVESVDHACSLLISRRRVKMFSVGVEKTGEAPHECRSDLLGVEGGRTDDAYLMRAPIVSDDTTACAPIHSVLGLVVAHGA